MAGDGEVGDAPKFRDPVEFRVTDWGVSTVRFLVVLAVPAVLCVLFIAACATHPPAPEIPGTVERHLTLMGTELEIRVEASGREQALRASERAVKSLEAAEARLSTWRDGTEMARLNAAPAGQPVPLSPGMAHDLGVARRCWEETGGAFDPSVGKLVQAWGLRAGGRRPAPEELAAAVAATGFDALDLRPDGLGGTTAVRRRDDLTLEEGAFGKGAGLADALAALAADPTVSRALLDLGGQVAMTGRDEDRWAIPVADPRRRDRPVVALVVAGGSVSTSGNSERGIVVDGHHLGHILDPRTGQPAPDFGSLTVWTADPLRADCLSTGLYVMGPEAALDWTAHHPGVEILVLRPRGKRLQALASPGLKDRLEILAEDVDATFSNPL
jgi:thiamine biosynthesis lipoprotein